MRGDIQHYVPQLLLRNFCGETPGRLFVFEKSTSRVFPANTRNVGGERDFYEFQIAGVKLSVDPALTSLESAAAPVISKIVDSESLRGLSTEDRATLSQFAAVQLVRTSHFRAQSRDLSKAIEAELRSRGLDPSTMEGYAPLDSESSKFLTAQALIGSDELASHIHSKDWVLFRAPSELPFWISDNPVSRQNFVVPAGWGLANPGVEIYLPLSAKLSLVFVCSTLRSGLLNLRSRQDAPHHGVTRLSESVAEARRFLAALESGEPLDCDAENVKNVNSMQVIFAERFVFSGVNDFSLAREMLETGRYRVGPRYRVF